MGVETKRNSLESLLALTRSGDLQFVYILGVPRSNSTIACRLLGRRLDGAVFEPAMPCTGNPVAHFADVILAVYETARRSVPQDRPVVLAIKDLSGFISDELAAFVLQARAIVFTIRDPIEQHTSLTRQFVHDFSAGERLYSVTHYFSEQLWFGRHLLTWAPRFRRLAREAFGPGWRNPLRDLVAGFNLSSWQRQAQLLDRAVERGIPFHIFDAELMRVDPARTEATFDEICRGLVPARTRPSENEKAGHSRMFKRSQWAKDAMSSTSVLPAAGATGGARQRGVPPPWLQAACRAIYPYYGLFFFHERHRGRIDAQSRSDPAVLDHMLRAANAEDALRTLFAPVA